MSFLLLLFSGFFILLAHPRLYWGETGYFGDPALLDLPLPVVLDQTGWARSLHFLSGWVMVINGLVYLIAGISNGHFRRRLVPSREQLRPRHILDDIRSHARFEVTAETTWGEYNLLQKAAYLLVIVLLVPTMLLSALTMSPAVTAVFPQLFDLFDGRQSARTIHFLGAALLLIFLVVHVLQVFVSGFREQMRSMLTGNPKSAARRQ